MIFIPKPLILKAWQYFAEINSVTLFILSLVLFAFGNQAYAQDFTDPPIWRHALGGSVIGNPVAQVESVVAITDGGNLKSFSSQGNTLWSYYARGRLTTHLSRSREGTSYICRTNGTLIAVNRSGRELWQIRLESPMISPVLIGWDGRLFVFSDRKITCMTAAGFTLWSKNLEKRTALPPVLDIDGGVILVQDDGEVLKFDPFGTVLAWASSEGELPIASVSLAADEKLPVILLVFEDGRMELIYSSTGYRESLKGKLDLPSAPLTVAGMDAAGRNVSGKKDEAAVLFKDGRVGIISLDKRRLLWILPSHAGPGELPNIAASRISDRDFPGFFYDERGVYILTKTGATGFMQDGRRLWTIRIKGATGIPSFGDDGILYSGGEDWILYAYRLEARVRVKQNLLYGETPVGTYGMGNPGPSSMADFHFRYDDNQLEARFNEIRRAVKEGKVGINEKEYVSWLMETAGSVVANPWSRNHPPVHTRYRVEAARLLAYMGSRETIPFLTELFNRDTEVLVKAAAAEAIGRIGVDPEGIAIRAFGNTILPSSLVSDETLLSSVAEAVGALCRFSGPPLSDAGIRILTILSRDDKPPGSRNKARQEIRSINR